jgi:hypothetical protein
MRPAEIREAMRVFFKWEAMSNPLALISREDMMF